jgi:ribosomal protein S18 acetylase RimI-like enzyme
MVTEEEVAPYTLPGFEDEDYPVKLVTVEQPDAVEYWVVRGGIIIGKAILWDPLTSQPVRKQYYWLNRIQIDPEYRGRGLGSTLMTLVCERVGSTRVKLCAVPESGQYLRLIQFYKRFGFRVTRTQIAGADMCRPAPKEKRK